MKKRTIYSIICGFCVLLLAGCPAMIVDSLKNKREIRVTNVSFRTDRYHRIAILPYNSTDGTERNLQGDAIYQYCWIELSKCKFDIPEKYVVINFLNDRNIDIVAKYKALDMKKVQSNHTIQKIARGLNVDAVLAIDIKTYYTGHWFGGNVVELETLLFDGNTENVIWRGYANVIHSPSKNYKKKIFLYIFNRLFTDLR